MGRQDSQLWQLVLNMNFMLVNCPPVMENQVSLTDMVVIGEGMGEDLRPCALAQCHKVVESRGDEMVGLYGDYTL